jgi:hypothetical protein
MYKFKLTEVQEEHGNLVVVYYSDEVPEAEGITLSILLPTATMEDAALIEYIAKFTPKRQLDAKAKAVGVAKSLSHIVNVEHTITPDLKNHVETLDDILRKANQA